MLVIAAWLMSPCPDWRRRKIAITNITGPLARDVKTPAKTINRHTQVANNRRFIWSIFRPVTGNRSALAIVPTR